MFRQICWRCFTKYSLLEKLPFYMQRNLKFHKISGYQQCSNIQKCNPLTIENTSSSKQLQGTSDILEEKLCKTKNFNNLFELITTHCNIMNNKHLSLAFASLFDYAKGQPGKRLFDPYEDKVFMQLCNHTMKLINHFTVDEIITIYKTMTYFNIPSTTTIMKSLGQMLRHNVNDLSLAQINFLILLLEKQEATPLIEALQIALPLVLQSQLDLQMDPSNIGEMVNCLKTLTKRNINNSSVEKLTTAIHQNADKISIREAYLIFTCLAPTQFRSKEINEILLYKSLDILSQNVEALTDKNIIRILSLMKQNRIFNKCFIELLSVRAIKERWDLWKLNNLFYICSKYEFVPIDLLNFTAHMIKTHPTDMETDLRISLLTIIEPFALIGYESIEIKDCCKIISQCEEKLKLFQKNSSSLFLKLNSHLAQLGYHPVPTVFSESVLSSISEHNSLHKIKINFSRELCVIEWATKLVFADYNGPFLPTYIFEEVINRIWKERQQKDYTFESFLSHGLGGDQFFETNVMTKYGHGIDYLIAMRKGNYPIAIKKLEDTEIKSRTKITFAEDLHIPMDSKIIAIIEADDSCFCKNSWQLKGWMKLQLDTLEKIGYLPLMINLENWKKLLDHEKIPYLMREIHAILNREQEKELYPVT